ncbi:uncharacterized protein Asalp_36970 [Aeromonas salmonicida subsp. pectinolytica 34mel]|uniref:Uncharacterized protein n=1 Tax=Aeromonas salmonicida subsp. pectinolytica 34mel TaxID=1324960 RepID=A0A2D1QK64_AERSA|nr:uncharacterized protein Asalp_36970 [Aeromonas salmonicida subsp. pectinolytica 34mel]
MWLLEAVVAASVRSAGWLAKAQCQRKVQIESHRERGESLARHVLPPSIGGAAAVPCKDVIC